MVAKIFVEELLWSLVDEQATMEFARLLAQCLCYKNSLRAAIIGLTGQIGSGKTSLIRATLNQLNLKTIKSPTFSLVETYSCNNLSINHFDLYRIHHEDELEYIGFRDYFIDESLCFIEWPEHAGRLVPRIDLKLNLSIKDLGRSMQILALTPIGKQILSCLVDNCND